MDIIRNHNFCVVEIGGFYLGIIKDVSTPRRRAPARRSAQTAMYQIASAWCAGVAPILSSRPKRHDFTPDVPAASVFLTTWHQSRPARKRESPSTGRRSSRSRADVGRELERRRAAGEIGAPREAEVDLYETEPDAARFAARGRIAVRNHQSQARVVTDTQRASAVPVER